MGATPVPVQRDRPVRPRVRGERLGRSRRRRGPRAAARSVRHARRRGCRDDDAQGRNRGGCPTAASPPRGGCDGDAPGPLERPRPLLSRPRRRSHEGAPAEADAGRGVRAVSRAPAGLPPARERRSRRRARVYGPTRRHRPVARCRAAASRRRRNGAEDDRDRGPSRRRDQLLGRRRHRSSDERDPFARRRSARRPARTRTLLELGCFVQVARDRRVRRQRAGGDPRARRDTRALLGLRGEADRGRRRRSSTISIATR